VGLAAMKADNNPEQSKEDYIKRNKTKKQTV